MPFLTRVTVLIVIVLMMQGCGFQLRGTYDLARGLSPMSIQSGEFRLMQSLGAQLRVNGIRVLNSEEGAASVLRIEKVSRTRRVVSVDARGRAREYELKYRLTWRLDFNDSDGARISEKTIELERELLFDPDAVLAIGTEIDTLYEDMQLDASRIILRQLQAVK